jgi:Uma2 family endonuclease
MVAWRGACVTLKAPMTAEEFAQMNTAETEAYELVAGELIPLPSAIPLQALVLLNAAFWVGNYLEAHRIGAVLGSVDCRISRDTVRRPDLLILLNERLQQVDPRKVPIPFAPDIAVEVLCLSDTAVDTHRKVGEYLGAGSKEVWILDHDNGQLFVHTAAGIRRLAGHDVLETPLLPGFAAPVSDLFATGF